MLKRHKYPWMTCQSNRPSNQPGKARLPTGRPIRFQRLEQPRKCSLLSLNLIMWDNFRWCCLCACIDSKALYGYTSEPNSLDNSVTGVIYCSNFFFVALLMYTCIKTSAYIACSHAKLYHLVQREDGHETHAAERGRDAPRAWRGSVQRFGTRGTL